MAALPSVGCKRRAAMLKRTLCAAFAVAVLVAFSVPAAYAQVFQHDITSKEKVGAEAR